MWRGTNLKLRNDWQPASLLLLRLFGSIPILGGSDPSLEFVSWSSAVRPTWLPTVSVVSA